ncbi:MAG: tetraacyldisaccharide 4'-kinase [Legionellales bacterium]|nr:tetraacyldisaccharide 4'-kinase [Legionellales bacterium]
MIIWHKLWNIGIMRASLELFLNRNWYQDQKVPLWLRPLEWIYSLVSQQGRIPNATQQSTPVIVIGNLNVGGMGKTPLVVALANKLLLQGASVAIISKPYRVRKFHGYHLLSLNDDSSLYGDEACMMRKQTNASIYVTFNRQRTIEQISSLYDLILVDDGLQDIHLKRSFNICVVDANKQFGTGHLLPAGPLRSSKYWMKHVDSICVRGQSNNLPAYHLEIQGFFELTDVNQHLIHDLPKKSIRVMTGIAHPDKLYQSLKPYNIQYEKTQFVDHHRWSQKDFYHIDEDTIIVSEKDAVKINFPVDKTILVAKTQLIMNTFLLELFNHLHRLYLDRKERSSEANTH